MAPYVDCHTHVFPPERMGKLIRWIHQVVPAHGVPLDHTPDDVVADLRRNGAARWANLLFPVWPNESHGLHRWGAELAARHPEMTPFGGVHPEDADPLGTVQEAVEVHGMAGFKFHPMVQRFTPWDDRLAAALDWVEAHRLPVYIHTGYEEMYGRPLDRGALDAFLSARRDLPVVIPHLGYPDLAWGFALADRFPSVWLDLTNVAGSILLFEPSQAKRSRLAALLREGLIAHRGRVMLGTDHPAGMGTIEEIFRQLDRMGLPDDVRQDVLLTTPARFFDRYGRPRR